MRHTTKIIIILFVFPLSVYANEEQSTNASPTFNSSENQVRVYRNPEERREAGLGTQLTDWLKFSGLLEFEKEYFENNLKNSAKQREYGRTTSALQLVLELEPLEWFGAEFVYDVEYDGHNSSAVWDEAFLYLELDDIGIGMELGRVSVPFGEFYSHFVTGPFLEFGETIRNGFIIDYSFLKNMEVATFVIDSDVEKINKNTEYDWGAALEYSSTDESIKIGVSYLSDLAESDERFLRDEQSVYEKRVSAWSAYSLIGFEYFEFTAEVVVANNRFREFDEQEDKPFAYNFEFAYFFSSNLQVALRLEGSDEFDGEPNTQFGISTSWRPIRQVGVTAEYLHGIYKNDFVFDDDDNEFDDRDLFAMQVTVEF